MTYVTICVSVLAFHSSLKWTGLGWEKVDVMYFSAPIKVKQHSKENVMIVVYVAGTVNQV